MKGTEFKTTTIVSFSVYSLSNYGLNYDILMRVSYTWSIFVTLTFHPLTVLLLPFSSLMLSSVSCFSVQTTTVSETVSILCVWVLFLLTCTRGVNSHTSSLALLQGGFGYCNESTPSPHLWIKTLEG